ncbi:3-oxoacyl-[acyl-carrier-protein] synthase III C-terminal domain-containing protein [Hamadaea tsunoensis]|uniref:3-oxoacyl-[acyl-carrier-protein] synthase III C-terminal domain-containing protein n=1 Tax=Hamadaea tsunoensis TaxID=53368 RepID=UPI0004252CB2|nr:3-oxoacyl-[acyl-carrier-protein] synthase III C-terminal domain-containing protein [Hamadaea tsunoensis]
MTALHEVAAFVPPSVPLASLGDHLGLSPMDVRVFERLHGLRDVAMATGTDWPDQVLAAAERLTGLPAYADRIRYVIAARSELPMAYTRPFPLHDIAAKLGLPDDVICFALAEHACASGLLAVHTAGRLLARDAVPGGLALVLTGEKASLPEVQHIPNQTIMAEGAAAVVVGDGGDRDRVLAYASRTGDGVVSYQDSYHDVFVDAMNEAVATAGLTWDDITVVLPHNVNRVSWVRIARQLGLPIERIFLDNVPKQAHSFSSDAFINYADVTAAGGLRPGDAYMMTASGVNTVASVMVLRH